MKNSILTFTFFLVSIFTFSQMSAQFNVIPEPVSINAKEGVFKLPKKISILRPSGTENDLTISFIANKLSEATGSQITVKNSGKGTIQFILNQPANSNLGNEGYQLTVDNKGVTIRSNSPAGLYYGAQTLVQLLPAEIESSSKTANAEWKIPAVEITDYPKVGWRGLMLDVSRHFFTVDEVKKYIDQMSRYKFNRLHLGLTNDEGWRIEIKSLPKLTEIGAWRVEKTGNFGSFSKPLPNEPKNYGGFYTQDQIRDIVDYAGKRFVQVMPEINVPGHSLAAIASYPELSGTPDAKNYSVRAGEPIIDWGTKPRHTALIDNNLSPAKENVYVFLDKIFTEVAQLFPFEYIHAGGDEATYNFWEKDPEVAALKKREGLKNMAEVQSYFSKRVEKIIQSKGKKMMGWDEVLEGGVLPSTAIMSWRGIDHGIYASKSGHNVVMSPTQFAYLDFMQGDISTEVPIYSSLRLNQTYKFNPVPEGADPKFVLGGQANLWTEQIYNYRQLSYMTWPRGFAISESVWSPDSKKNWNHFVRKTEDHFKRFDLAEIKYSPAIYDPSITVKKEGEKYFVELTPEIEGLALYTSFDNSEPDNFYPQYSKPQLIPKDASLMRIISYRDNKPIGRLMTITVEDLKKRAGN